MSPILVLSVLLQIACAVHVVRTGRPLYWIFILLVGSFLGIAVYLFAEVLPNLGNSPTARRAVRGVRNRIDPEHGKRRASRNLEIADTLDNRRRLAEQSMASGDYQQALVAALQQFVGRQWLERVELVEQHRLQAACHLGRVSMRATDGLSDQLVDQAQAQQAFGGDAHLLGGVLGLVAGLPQDRGAAFRRDDRVGAVLEHQRAVADADRQRATGSAFTDHSADHRHLQLGHFQQVAGDGFGLAAFLGADAWIGAGRVDEGQDRQMEAFGHLHQAQGLPVALGSRHAEVAADLALGVAAFLVANDHHAAAVDTRETAHDRGVIGKGAVAGQFLELVADHPDVVVGVRPRGMPRQLRHLPGREVAEDVRGPLPQLVLQRVHFGVHIDCGAVAGMSQFLDFGFQIGDGLLEIEVVRIHRGAQAEKGDSLTRPRKSHRLRPPWAALVSPGRAAKPGSPPGPGSPTV